MSCLLIATTTLLGLAVAVYLYVKNCYSYWKRRGLPYLEPRFIFGNFYDAAVQTRSLAEIVTEAYNSSTAPMVGVYLGLKPVIIPRDPKLIQTMMNKENVTFSSRGINVNEHVDKMVANLFLQNGERWKEMRKMLSPAFTTGRLKHVFDTIVKCADPLTRHIKKFADSGETVEVSYVIGSYTNNVIASVAFGLEVDCINEPDSKFRTLAGRFFEPSIKNGFRSFVGIMSEWLTKLLRLRFVDKEVQDFMTDLVRQNLEYREKNDIIRKDIFQSLIQVRNRGKVQEEGDWSIKSSGEEKLLSLDEMAAQTFIFYSAGFESSATTMTFCLYELARNPEIQQKVYENIESVLSRHDGELTYDALSEMRYLEDCIEESLRMHSPFGFFPRKCIQDYKLPDSDVIIEKGTTVLFPVGGLHYDSQYYEEPDKFIPERHSDVGKSGKTFAEMPLLAFGDGPRFCIGMRLAKLQMKIGLCSLLKTFTFSLDDVHKNVPLKFKTNTIVRTSAIGINLKVVAR